MSKFPQRVVLITGAVTTLLIGGLGVALLSSHSQARTDLQDGFKQRAKIAASLIESIMTQTTQSTVQSNRAAFSGLDLTNADVRKKLRMPGGRMTVVGPDGRTIAGWPVEAGRKGARPDAPAAAVSDVLDGRDWTPVIGESETSDVSLLAGIDTPSGRRVVISTFPRSLMQAFLGGYLNRIRTTEEDDAFLIDEHGGVLGTGSGRTSTGMTLPTSGTGTISLAGTKSFYAAAPVVGTNWAVVVAAPEAQLYAPVEGLSAWLPWALLIGVSLLALVVIVLVRRMAESSADLAAANDHLAARNEEVVAADRMKSDFLATMSHELRTPLNGIIGFAELMHDGRVGPVSDQHREYLGDILSSSNHLRRLIDDVLDLSKIEAGKIDLRPETVDCCAVINEVCDVVGSLAVRKHIRLETECDEAIGPLELDPSKLKQVLFNYVSNALKFTPEGGTVSIRAYAEPGNRFRIVVEDDGPGIKDEDRARLWSAFEQLDTGSSRRHGGTGLGLSLTRSIVEAQGGEVGVSSEIGVGSRFHVILPCVVTGVTTTRAAAPIPDIVLV